MFHGFLDVESLDVAFCRVAVSKEFSLFHVAKFLLVFRNITANFLFIQPNVKTFRSMNVDCKNAAMVVQHMKHIIAVC